MCDNSVTGKQPFTPAQSGSVNSPADIPFGQYKKSVQFLQNVLRTAQHLNPAFLSDNYRWMAKSTVGFDLAWGLGSSSSLISNIAWWAGIDPFSLAFAISPGSGYDIACARESSPLLYSYRGRKRPPIIQPTRFFPPFASHLVFVYSGKKQDSAESIIAFSTAGIPEHTIQRITRISENMATTNDLEDFVRFMREHESIVGEVLGRDPVQKMFFDDFPGTVKSLGAWGGDFFLAASDMDQAEAIAYFTAKGYDTVLPYYTLCYTAKETGNA